MNENFVSGWEATHCNKIMRERWYYKDISFSYMKKIKTTEKKL